VESAKLESVGIPERENRHGSAGKRESAREPSATKRRPDIYTRLLREAKALPGVQDAALTSAVPLAGAGNTAGEVQIPGKPAAPDGSQPSSAWRVVSPGYLRTLGIPLRGRDFDERDGAESQPVTILAPALTRLLNRTTVDWDRVKPRRSPQSTERLMEMRSSLGFIN
jgi:hypothetical protein